MKLSFLPTPDPKCVGICFVHSHSPKDNKSKNNYIFQIIIRTEQVLYTKDTLTPYDTQLDSALLSPKTRIFKKQLQMNQASKRYSRKTKGMYLEDLRKLCFVYGRNAFLKLKSSNSYRRK